MHPFHKHRETKKSYERVSKILEEQPSGASAHATGSAYSRSASKGEATSHDDRRPHGGKFARGGRLPTAGAESGVGRLQKAGK